MKIAIIQAALAMSGGGERQAIMLAKELRKIGHDARLYAFFYDSEKCFPGELKNIPVVSLPLITPKFKRFFRIPFIGATLHMLHENNLAKKLAKTIPGDIDVLNPHDQTSCRTVHYFKKDHPTIPAILMLNDLHTHSWSLFDDKMFARARKSFIKMIFYKLWDFLERKIFWGCVNNIAVLNERTTQILKRETGRNSVVVRSGVDADKFRFVERKPVEKHGEIRLLAHGIFYVHRRYEDIIFAVKILRDKGYDARLRIIGDFNFRDIARSYYEKLLKIVKENHLEKFISFNGVVDEDELLGAYYGSNIFVSATHMQTWGLAVFEALASGLPAVISKTIGAAEVLKDGETALFIEPGNPESIARAIIRLTENGALYEKLSKNGADFVRENLSWKKYAGNMLNLFEKSA